MYMYMIKTQGVLGKETIMINGDCLTVEENFISVKLDNKIVCTIRKDNVTYVIRTDNNIVRQGIDCHRTIKDRIDGFGIYA